MVIYKPKTPRERSLLPSQGMRIRLARIEMRLSQKKLADLTEGMLCQQAISDIELGKRDITLSEALVIAECLGKGLENLVSHSSSC